MVRKTAVLFCACGLALVPVAGTSGAQEPQGQVELKLVWEREFDKEIRGVVFGETADGSLYPKVVVFDDEVRFCDERGDAVADRSIESYWAAAPSQEGTYIGIQELLHHPTERGAGVMRFSVYTGSGEQVWSKDEEKAYDYPAPTWYVSNRDGSAIRADSPAGSVQFVDSTGATTREADLFHDDEWDLERALHCALSTDGRFCLMGFQKQPAVTPGVVSGSDPGATGHPYLALFTHEGIELWRHELPVFLSYGVAGTPLSATGSYGVGSGYTIHHQEGLVDACTWLMDMDGQTVAEASALTYCASFSSNERYVALHCYELGAGPAILVMESRTGKALWKRDLPVHAGRAVGLSVSDGGEVFVVLGNGRADDTGQQLSPTPQVWLLDASGTLLRETTLPGARVFGATISKAGRHLAIFTPRGVRVYELVNK
jgi:hypothetical protein